MPGWGDRDLARDVAQEAFLEVYLNLNQLNSAMAFPGWLRRIVIKHCDRQTRRKHILLSHTAESDESADADASPLKNLITAEEQQGVRNAVESLPENVRMVVALHYFGGASGQDMADFLELPLSTIKKRLRVARNELREKDMKKIEKVEVRDGQFPDEIALFVAIREGDHNEVSRLLDKNPELIIAEQNWDRELVYSGVLPFATKATGLITAIELDDIKMQKLLLDRGADVDGKCGCEAGEPPLWAAALLNRSEHVKHLLEKGADPNVRSASGNTPLHIAAMRGYTNIARMLVESNADTELRDADSEAIWPLTVGAKNKQGWVPVDWARHNGHSDIVKLLDGDTRTSSARSNKPAGDHDVLLETGIKALDFFAPLKKGSLIRVPFKAGVGMAVLLGELNQRFLLRPSGAVVWTGFTQPPFDLLDLEAEMRELGFREQIHLNMASYQASEDVQRQAFNEGLRSLEVLRDQGKEVLAVVQSVEGFEADVEQSLLRLTQPSAIGSITSIVLTPFRDEEQAWISLKAPYSTQITLDRNRAVKHLYPAIDPARSMSASDGNVISDRHQLLMTTVKTLFDSLDGLETALKANSHSSSIEQCAGELLGFLTQPFRITEPFRGTPGESVRLKEVLDEVESILDRHGMTS